MVPLAQLKLSEKKKKISYQKIKNSSKGYYCRVLRQKKNVVKKNSIYRCVTGYLYVFTRYCEYC